MTAPINPSEFITSDDPFVITTTLWRGAMLDRFARAEYTVLLCLRALRGFEVSLPPDAFQDGAKTRLRALIATLRATDVGTNSAAALRSLEHLLEISDNRTALAHGRVRPKAGGVLITWTKPKRDGDLSFERRQIALTAMLEELMVLDKLQRDLSSQLGQVRKAAQGRRDQPL